MTDNLTHKDKKDLNRRAKAHGLPALWPEAEEQLRTLDRFFENLTRSHARNMANLGMLNDPAAGARSAWMSTPWHSDSLSSYLQIARLGMGVPYMSIDPSSALEPYASHVLIDPAVAQQDLFGILGPSPTRPSPLSRLKNYLRYRVGLP